MVDEELLSGLGLSKLPLTKTKCLKPIDTEMAAGFDSLRHISRPVSFFGSSRTPRGHHDDEQTRAVAGLAGFAAITRGGPGLIEAANRGARDAWTARSDSPSPCDMSNTSTTTSTCVRASTTTSP